MFDFALLAIAGFAAGILNAIAGGGTFLTLPALMYVGVPPIMANATATLAVVPGYISSAWAFRHDLKAEGALSLRAVLTVAAIGGGVGALLLIITPGEAFLWVVPWLLLVATILFAAGPQLSGALNRFGRGGAGVVASAVAILGVSIYGGYFNGGLGIMLLATFGLLGYTNLHAMNGLKNMLSALLSVVSAVAFMLAGLIVWQEAMVMALAAAAGGYCGAAYSRQIKRTGVLRAIVSMIGAGMTVAFFAT